MPKITIAVPLMYPEEIADTGKTVDTVTVKLINYATRERLGAEYKKNEEALNLAIMHHRIDSVSDSQGSFRMDSLDIEVLKNFSLPNHNRIMEAMLALDIGYDDWEKFRDSERYKNLVGDVE